MYDIERKAIEEHIAECQKRIKVIEGVMEINPDRDKEECMHNITRLKIAVSALRELRQYRERIEQLKHAEVRRFECRLPDGRICHFSDFMEFLEKGEVK